MTEYANTWYENNLIDRGFSVLNYRRERKQHRWIPRNWPEYTIAQHVAARYIRILLKKISPQKEIILRLQLTDWGIRGKEQGKNKPFNADYMFKDCGDLSSFIYRFMIWREGLTSSSSAWGRMGPTGYRVFQMPDESKTLYLITRSQKKIDTLDALHRCLRNLEKDEATFIRREKKGAKLRQRWRNVNA